MVVQPALLKGVVAAVVVSFLVSGAEGLKCLDNSGKPVDWWFMYKTPDGYKFAYNDPSSGDATTPLAMFDRDMDDEADPVAITRTLQAIAESGEFGGGGSGGNSNSSDAPPGGVSGASYYLYNDQPDNAVASSSYGHTKGVIAADADARSGLWITHSTPHWPASTGKAKFYFPPEEIKFGQTFLCLSLDQDQLDAVGQQQLLTRPYVYHRTNLFARANSTIAAAYPNLAKVLAGAWDEVAGTRTQLLNVGSKLQTFTSLAKNKEWDSDLWEQLVAAHYGSGFLVESWMRGQQLGPYCPPQYGQEVVDARSLYVTEGGANVTGTETQDHAKWGVSLDSSYVVCVGDINRMLSQRKRGGGAVCFSNRKLSYGMYNTVNSSDVCTKEERHRQQQQRRQQR